MLVTPALLWTLLFFVRLRAMALLSFNFQAEGGMTVFELQPVLHQPQLLPRHDQLAGGDRPVTVISVLLAYPFAWILAEQIPPRLQRLALLLPSCPSGLPTLCAPTPGFWCWRTTAWSMRRCCALGLVTEPLQLANTRTATMIGFVHFFVMLLTLTIFASLKQLNPSYRRAAADLGAGPMRTFIYIILPLTLPGVIVGAFLTFVLAIGDYITPQILGGNNELLMPQLIMMQIGRRGDFP